jgi:outer membrane protein TolC
MFFALCALLLASVSCSMVEKRIDRTAGGPNVPADTTVQMRMEPGEPSEETAARTMPPGPLKVTVIEAILLCLENNRSLVVQRLNPSIQQTAEEQERAVFDPTIDAEVFAGRVKAERLARSGSDTEDFTNNTVDGIISLEQYFPTGTTVALEASSEMEDSSLYDSSFYSTRLGMTVTQALLQGYGTDVNLARLRQARLDTRLSEYELRGFTEFLVAEVERTYWDYALARRQIEIVDESLKVARQQLNETKHRFACNCCACSILRGLESGSGKLI